jgi:hypothetical protein
MHGAMLAVPRCKFFILFSLLPNCVIHILSCLFKKEGVDARHKAGHDAVVHSPSRGGTGIAARAGNRLRGCLTLYRDKYTHEADGDVAERLKAAVC